MLSNSPGLGLVERRLAAGRETRATITGVTRGVRRNAPRPRALPVRIFRVCRPPGRRRPSSGGGKCRGKCSGNLAVSAAATALVELRNSMTILPRRQVQCFESSSICECAAPIAYATCAIDGTSPQSKRKGGVQYRHTAAARSCPQASGPDKRPHELFAAVRPISGKIAARPRGSAKRRVALDRSCRRDVPKSLPKADAGPAG